MKKMRKFTKSRMIEKLWEVIALLDHPKDVRLFLEDILYPSEVSMLGQRLLVATLLRRGLSHEQVFGKTGASMGTVNRIWQVMHRGTGGYELALMTLQVHRMQQTYRQKELAKTPVQRYLERRIRKGK
jgi:TrpR-related protein YerC/YecD